MMTTDNDVLLDIPELTPEQLEAIRAVSKAEQLPDSNFTERLFDDNDTLLDIPDHIWQQCKAYKECPKGWRETAKKVEAVLLAESVQVRQMKEKFGGLRVYWDWPEEWNDLEESTFHDKCEQIELLINVTDWVCQRTCMVCGENGTLYKENWINVLCEEHYNEWKERLKGEKAQ